MNALLLIFVFAVGNGPGTAAPGHTYSVPFPTMAGCQVAAAEVRKVGAPGAVGAMCVDYK
jgi:hypothetical protein